MSQDPNVNEVQHVNDIRGAVAYVFDTTLTGNGFTGQYRPARPSDFGGGGGLITGIADSEQRFQIVGSGNVNTAPVATVVDINGIGALVTSGINGGGGGTSSMVGVTGSDGLSAQVINSNGYRALSVMIASGSSVGSSIVGISGTTGQIVGIIDSGLFTALVTAAQGLRASGYTGAMPFPVLAGSFINSDATGQFSDRQLTSHQSDIFGNLWVSLGTALDGAVDSIAAVQSGLWKVGITGVTGLGLEVRSVSGFNAIPVFFASGSFPASSAGGGGSITGIVGISGTTGQIVSVLNTGAFVGLVTNTQGIRPSGFSGTMPLPVLGGAVTDCVHTGIIDDQTLTALRADAYGNLWVSLGTALNNAVDSVTVTQSGAWQVGVTGGQVGITGQVSVSNSSTIVGVSGTTGQIVNVLNSGGFNGLVGDVQGVRITGYTGTMPLPVLVGTYVSTGTNTLTNNSLTTHQSDVDGNLWVSLGTALSSTIDTVSAAQTGLWKVGITGTTGLGLEVRSVSGFNAIPVFIASGVLAGGGSSTVGVSGTTGQFVDVLDSGGFKGLVSDVQGVRVSGYTGTMPHPVAVGQYINNDTTGTFTEHALVHHQGDSYGNLWVTLGTALSHLVDSMSTRPQLPTSQGVYSFNVTGTGFSNYTGVIPVVTGNCVVMSIEPHSENTQPVYYALSGAATTGNAWEIRGDRSIEVSGNQYLFFGTQAGTGRLMVHYQIF